MNEQKIQTKLWHVLIVKEKKIVDHTVTLNPFLVTQLMSFIVWGGFRHLVSAGNKRKEMLFNKQKYNNVSDHFSLNVNIYLRAEVPKP